MKGGRKVSAKERLVAYYRKLCCQVSIDPDEDLWKRNYLATRYKTTEASEIGKREMELLILDLESVVKHSKEIVWTADGIPAFQETR